MTSASGGQMTSLPVFRATTVTGCWVCTTTEFTTAETLFSQSLELPGRLHGYDALTRLVMCGELNDTALVGGAVNAFWSGVEAWAAAQYISFTYNLENLLTE